MSLLTDHEIRYALDLGQIEIDPYPNIDAVQPCSVDLHLGKEIIRFRYNSSVSVRFRQSLVEGADCIHETYEDGQNIRLDCGEFILARTAERIRVGNNFAAQVDGKSSSARYGLLIHLTAGFFDPGWNGVGTLEIVNLFTRPVILRPGDSIAQVFFTRLSMPVSRPYGSNGLNSHYQNAKSVETGKAL
jgi:dCTP deaminase